MLPIVRLVTQFIQSYSCEKAVNFNKCQQGSAVIEYGLLAAFVAGGVLSGSSYFTHNASAGENALLGVFSVPEAGNSSSGTKSHTGNEGENRERMLVTE